MNMESTYRTAQFLGPIAKCGNRRFGLFRPGGARPRTEDMIGYIDAHKDCHGGESVRYRGLSRRCILSTRPRAMRRNWLRRVLKPPGEAGATPTTLRWQRRSMACARRG